jgi:putative oxidoreductase
MNAYGVDIQTLSLGLLLVRVVIGLVMAAHGAQKLLGWFGGYGLNKTGEFFVQLGFWPGRAFAAAASATEITSGLLVTVGLLGPIGPALMISVMIVAMITVHWKNGLFAADNGVEVPLLYATIAFAIALIGFGRYSLDDWFGIDEKWSSLVRWIVLAVGVAGGLVNAGIRRRFVPAARG